MLIPKELLGKEINLQPMGLNEVAWLYDDALKFISHCENNSIFILGGDVLSKDDKEYRHNYDNWSFEPEQGNYKDSIIKTKDYINNYPKGEYAFVFVTQ